MAGNRRQCRASGFVLPPFATTARFPHQTVRPPSRCLCSELRNPADRVTCDEISRDFFVFLRHSAKVPPRSALCSRRGSAGLRCAAPRPDAMRPNPPVIPPSPAPRLCRRGSRRAGSGTGQWHGGDRQLRNGSGWSQNRPEPLPCPPPTRALRNWSACWPGTRRGISSRPRSARGVTNIPTDQEARR